MMLTYLNLTCKHLPPQDAPANIRICWTSKQDGRFKSPLVTQARADEIIASLEADEDIEEYHTEKE
jgi:hypothetical protein